MTGITQGPVGINSHVPVESTADAWQESKLLGCVVSWIRLPIEAIKTVAGILYSVIDKGELASRSLKNLGISLIGSCPVLGAIGVTKLHQRTVTSLNQIENFIPNFANVDEQKTFLERFFQQDPSKLSLKERIKTHLVLQKMTLATTIEIYNQHKSATMSETDNDLITKKIADFLNNYNYDPNCISSDELNTLIEFSKKNNINKLKNKLQNTKQLREDMVKSLKDKGLRTLEDLLSQYQALPKSVWQQEFIQHIEDEHDLQQKRSAVANIPPEIFKNSVKDQSTEDLDKNIKFFTRADRLDLVAICEAEKQSRVSSSTS